MLGVNGLYCYHHRGFPRGNAGYWGRLNIVQNLSAVTSDCLIMRRNVFEEAGGFDEEYVIGAYDVDLCLKARQKGYLVVWMPYVELIYYGRERKAHFEASESDLNRFKQRWHNIIQKGDPYYNPNLTDKRGDFLLKI